MSNYDEKRLNEALRQIFPGSRLTIFSEVSSTNDAGKSQPTIQDESVACGLQLHLFLAERQTAGRGRMGRTWSSPAAGDIYMTLVLDASFPLDYASIMPLAVGYAAHQALVFAIRRQASYRSPANCQNEVLREEELQLKWPNDILYGGQKISGILCESQLAAGLENAYTGVQSRLKRLILGIGMNVSRQDFPKELEGIACSLQGLASGYAWSREDIIIDFLREWKALWDSDLTRLESVTALLDCYRPLCMNLGKDIKISTADGRVREAVAVDIDWQGGLVVRYPSGQMESIRSGEVTLRYEEW